MITGDVSDTRYMTDDFFKKATGTDDKKVVYIEAANHIETYWKPEFVWQEVSRVINFLNKKYCNKKFFKMNYVKLIIFRRFK